MRYFSELSDPRVERNREHRLDEILLIAIAAVLSGAESWNDIAEFGEEKLVWLKTFLTLPGGIPSHDTFNRVFTALASKANSTGCSMSPFEKITAEKRAGHAAQNFSAIDKTALNLLQQDKSFQRSVKGKRLKAAWSQDYLGLLLGI